MNTPLHQRGDLLDRIDTALTNADTPAYRELLEAAAQRIRDLNTEHDRLCSERPT